MTRWSPAPPVAGPVGSDASASSSRISDPSSIRARSMSGWCCGPVTLLGRYTEALERRVPPRRGRLVAGAPERQRGLRSLEDIAVVVPSLLERRPRRCIADPLRLPPHGGGRVD